MTITTEDFKHATRVSFYSTASIDSNEEQGLSGFEDRRESLTSRDVLPAKSTKMSLLEAVARAAATITDFEDLSDIDSPASPKEEEDYNFDLVGTPETVFRQVSETEPLTTEGRSIIIPPSPPGRSAKKTHSVRFVPEEDEDINDFSFEELFDRWQTTRITKRRCPSLQAYPDIPPFYNPMESSPFHSYFDRWYGVQRHRYGMPQHFTGTANVIAHDKELDSWCLQLLQSMERLPKYPDLPESFRLEESVLPPTFTPGAYTFVQDDANCSGRIYLSHICKKFGYFYSALGLTKKAILITEIMRFMYSKNRLVGAFVKLSNGRYYELDDLTVRKILSSELSHRVMVENTRTYKKSKPKPAKKSRVSKKRTYVK